jgi:hypothetical protein
MAKPNKEIRGRLAELQAIDVWLREAQKRFMALTTGDVLDKITNRMDEIWNSIKEKHR